MLRSLVGSEMCIRDSFTTEPCRDEPLTLIRHPHRRHSGVNTQRSQGFRSHRRHPSEGSTIRRENRRQESSPLPITDSSSAESPAPRTAEPLGCVLTPPIMSVSPSSALPITDSSSAESPAPRTAEPLGCVLTPPIMSAVSYTHLTL